MLPDLIDGLRARAQFIEGVAVTRVANGNRPTLAERPEIFFWGRLEIPPYVEPNLEQAPADIRFFADRRSRYLADTKQRYERAPPQINARQDQRKACRAAIGARRRWRFF